MGFLLSTVRNFVVSVRMSFLCTAFTVTIIVCIAGDGFRRKDIYSKSCIIKRQITVGKLSIERCIINGGFEILLYVIESDNNTGGSVRTRVVA